MPTVKIQETAEEALPPPPPERKTSSATDSRGRLLAVKKLSALDRMRMAIVLGADNSSNQQVMLYANLAWSVTAIDGEALLPPNSMSELQHRVGSLDEDGLATVVEAWKTAGWIDPDPERAAAAHVDAVGNSHATLASPPGRGL